MTDFRALCEELVEELEGWIGYGCADADAVVDRARAALAEQPVGPTKAEIHSLADDILDGDRASCVDFARAVLARWGNHPGSPDSSDGPAMSNDREPASVMDQLSYQLYRRAKILLVRKVIDRAIRDTASVHWRVADTGEQLVRATDLLAWAEHMEKQMEQLDD